MVELEPVEDRLMKRIIRHLQSIRPTRQDSDALDLLSARHIHELSFRPLQEPAASSVANYLVPLQVANSKTNQAWRYAPYARLDLPIIEPCPSARIQLWFSVPTWISYAEQGREHPIRRATLRDTKPPQAFFQIESAETWEDAGLSRSLLEDDGEHVKVRSYSLTHYTWETIVDLSQNQFRKEETLEAHNFRRSLRLYDPSSQNILGEGHPDRGWGIIEETAQSVHLTITIRLVKPENGSPSRLVIEIMNTSPLTTDQARAESKWHQFCLVFPHLSIQFSQAQRYPPHDEMLYLATATQNENRTQYMEKVRDNAPTTVNGIATLVDYPTSRISFAMTAIHDSPLLEPAAGPSLSLLLEEGRLMEELTEFSSRERDLLLRSGKVALVKGVLETVHRAFPFINTLHRFQWQAIQRRARLLLDGSYRGTCHLIKAPTGTGKTLVFMADALLHHLWTGERVAITFPTRILNEDMYRRLTLFIHHAREVFTSSGVTGGILIGTRDPLYQAVASPEAGRPMVQFDKCPKCGSSGSVVAEVQGSRTIGVCHDSTCGHKIDYMYGSMESSDYLPSILIATPDKLFYEATARMGPEAFPLRLFGGQFRRCSSCGAASPPISEYNTNCSRCNSSALGDLKREPIFFWIFDEVHSLYGLTGIYLSTFLAALQVYWKRIAEPNAEQVSSDPVFSFEVGTATISNERELLTELTRIRSPERTLVTTPVESEFTTCFVPDAARNRYRTLITMPIGTSINELSVRDMIHTRRSLFDDRRTQETLSRLLHLTPDSAPYDMSLTYVQRKDLGNGLAREYGHRTRQLYGQTESIPFISGDTPNHHLAEYFRRANRGQLRNLVANVVISLGVDIERLNHMIIVSVPESITEFVQIAGRTGRRSGKPGHAHVLLRPDYPRDLEFYEGFHYMLSDLRGYYDSKPMQRANYYAARRIFPNILRLVLTAHSSHEPNWMLTANQASRKLAQQPALRLRVLRDIADAFVGRDSQQYRAYLVLANEELTAILANWNRLVGSGNYIGSILNADQLLLFTLRPSEERDVPIRPVDSLAGQMEQARHHALGFAGGGADDQATGDGG